MKHARIGTVIAGTLRQDELMEAFADELEHHIQGNAKHWCSDEGRQTRDRLLGLVWEAREATDTDEDEERLQEICDDLIEALTAFAPPGAYFGTHWGDGSDFGFWMTDEMEDAS